MLFAFLMATTPLPHYNDLPNPSRESVRSCGDEYDRLQSFVSRFKTVVFNRELDRGGRLQWRQGNQIRNAADMTARPYLEGIRQVAYTGNVKECRRLSREGVYRVTEDVIRPVFGD